MTPRPQCLPIDDPNQALHLLRQLDDCFLVLIDLCPVTLGRPVQRPDVTISIRARRVRLHEEVLDLVDVQVVVDA